VSKNVEMDFSKTLVLVKHVQKIVKHVVTKKIVLFVKFQMFYKMPNVWPHVKQDMMNKMEFVRNQILNFQNMKVKYSTIQTKESLYN